MPQLRARYRPLSRPAATSAMVLNEAGVIALLHIMARTEDSNIVQRRGEGALKRLQRNIRRGLCPNSGPSRSCFKYAAKLSPGGSADLLSLTYFLHFLFQRPPGGPWTIEAAN
ncbi:MAG: triphosphoribosyl-dephospho-CoA synthase [Candidatus Adiutrix sp.]|nr:triphosphoribosyl-dephospho-CoA synthase [Candidatus Adiutrix sp.]